MVRLKSEFFNCCSGESTARRVSLGSHNETDFWDQVAEGALMAQVVDTWFQ